MMVDKLTPEHRSVNMSRIRSRDMKPELVVRRATHSLGYRYRLHDKRLPGKPDLVFASKRKVIFVHGCFWHQHDDPACLDGRPPKSNSGYWDAKLNRNVARDAEQIARLQEMGWGVLVIWECAVKDQVKLSKKISRFLGPRLVT